MSEKKNIVANSLPTKTYRFLQVNDSALAVPEGVSVPERVKTGSSENNLPGGITCEQVLYAECEAFDKAPGGMGPETDALFADRQAVAWMFRVGEGVKNEGLLVNTYNASPGRMVIDPTVIHAGRDSEITIAVNTIESSGTVCAASKGFLGFSTKIYAEAGSKVKLVHVQRLDRGFTHFDDIGVFCEEGASVEFTALSLGGGDVHIGARATLAGDDSAFTSRTGYFCGGHSSLDMNFIADQRGRKTTSDMVFRGVLADQAKKTFRGTIDFKKGSKGSAGDEQEDTLTLSADVVNRAVPVILCAEEDVEGRHGASIGQLSEDMLFYMRSRGYSEEEARRLIVQARLKSVTREISDEKLRWEIEQWIEREVR